MDQLLQQFLIRFVKISAFGFCLLLIQCDSTYVYQPKIPDHAAFKVSHLGTYSSKIDEEKELEGTIFQTTLSYQWEKSAAGYSLTRKLDTLVGRGYHKASMPHELEKKVPLVTELNGNLSPIQITGYDSLKAILSRIDQKADYRKQLLISSDTNLYKAQSRDWWRMARFLPMGQKLLMKQNLPVDKLNSTLESFKVDSAKFVGPRPRLKKSCLDYSLYYHRTDSLPLLVEQFYFSAIPNRKFRKYTHKPAIVLGTLQFSMNRDTGLPCFFARSEIGEMLMEFKEDKVETPIHLYRYEEDIYD